MNADTLMKEYVCRLCGRVPITDIVMTEDGFCYHRKCNEKTKNESGSEEMIFSPVTKKQIGGTLITPKTITCLIGKLRDDETSDLGTSRR